MKRRNGIEEVQVTKKGHSSIRSGYVTDHEVVGCPKVDTIYLQLIRNQEEVLFMAITPEEAQIIGKMFLCLSVEGK